MPPVCLPRRADTQQALTRLPAPSFPVCLPVDSSAQITAWDGCPPGWADTFCAAGGGFLQYCPHDKGSPALMKVGGATVQVGLTSGPGCTGEADNWGYFVRLADKDVLRQLLVWMNSRAGTANDGLDATVQQWIEEANAYLDQP